MSRRAVVLLNPKAGAGRALRGWSRAEPLLRASFDVVDVWPSREPGHATELARQAAAEGPDAIVAVGGDGTVHEIVNGMVPGEVPLGILPFGTGNDFARAMGITARPEEAARTVASRRTRRVDLGRVHGHHYVQVAGTGFDAIVAQRVNEGGRAGSGALTYIGHLLRTMVTYRNTELTLRQAPDGDGSEANPEEAPPPLAAGKMLLLAVANTPYYAGGMKICPEARPDDAALEWCAIGDLTKLEVLGALPRVFSGGHVRLPKITTGRAPSLLVEGPPGLPVHADGELVGSLPARFDCVPDALTVIVPA